MITRSPLRKSFFAFLIVCVLPSIASAQMPQFDSLYVFGDSLADNGNVLIQSTALGVNPPVPPVTTYFEGRFSNGYVEFEYLWECLKAKACPKGKLPDGVDGVKPFLAAPIFGAARAIDFAYGGTGTPYLDQTPGGMWAPGLKGQIELFRLSLHGKKPSNHALYAIATGANDYRPADQFNVPMAPEAVVRNIEDGIVTLYQLGARDVIVLDLPDLGLIPAAGGDPGGTQSMISAAHNDILYKRLATLQARLPKLHLIVVKLDPLFKRLLDLFDPLGPIPALSWFFPNTPQAVCLFVNPSLCLFEDATPFFNIDLGFLFWDIVHPTTEAHRYLAEYLYDKLKASY